MNAFINNFGSWTEGKKQVHVLRSQPVIHFENYEE